MTSYFQNASILLVLFLGVACSSMAVSEQFNVEDYLLEAKECLNAEGSERMELPSYLRRYLEQVSVEDYVSHTYLDPKELSIDFRKSQDGDSFSISLHIDLDKNKGCERISVYEILGSN
ncbi:MAG: hypothetical protein P8166_16060 [Candidatus Thiodiazotropha sp.]